MARKPEWVHGYLNATHMIVEEPKFYRGSTRQALQLAENRDWIIEYDNKAQEVALSPAFDYIEAELENADELEVLLGGIYNRATNVMTVDMVVVVEESF